MSCSFVNGSLRVERNLLLLVASADAAATSFISRLKGEEYVDLVSSSTFMTLRMRSPVSCCWIEFRWRALSAQNLSSANGPGCELFLSTISGSSLSTFLICLVQRTTAVSSTYTRSLSLVARSAEGSSIGGSGRSVSPLVWPMVT